jgi:hypothetical protein
VDFVGFLDCGNFDQFVLTATTIQWPKTGKSMISDKPK